MREWTPDKLFICTWIVAAMGGLAVLLASNRPITVRNVLSSLLLYGLAGCGLGMIGYEWLQGEKYPWRVIGAGMLVGLRIIKWDWIRRIAGKILLADSNGHTVD